MTEIQAFVKESLVAGHPRFEIATVLGNAGWPSDEVREALDAFAEVEFPIPVPKRRSAGSAREAFLYMVTFFALYTGAIALGTLCCGIVDHFFPDPLADRYAYSSGDFEGLRWSIASLIVSFPIYIGLTRQHLLEYRRDANRRTSAVRKWLTYLTLFVAAAVAVVTLIVLLGNLLGGQIAARFLLKSFVVLAIAGGMFAFYRWEIRSADGGSR
jgi:hypothetical protein